MDSSAFLKASFSPREASIDVPQLAEFFEDDSPKWKVRSLTAAELARCNNAGETTKKTAALVQALSEGPNADAIRKLAGIVDAGTPEDVSRRIQALVIGSVEPALSEENRDVAVKLAETFPMIFYALTNRIFELTGEGSEPGKRKASGKAQKSAP